MNRGEIVDLLSKNVANVIFEKKDGTIRDMRCTLIANEIPEDKQPKYDSDRKVNLDVLAVFDIVLGEWRSFRVDSVKEIYLL